jgi:hypothetical protein
MQIDFMKQFTDARKILILNTLKLAMNVMEKVDLEKALVLSVADVVL